MSEIKARTTGKARRKRWWEEEREWRERNGAVKSYRVDPDQLRRDGGVIRRTDVRQKLL